MDSDFSKEKGVRGFSLHGFFFEILKQLGKAANRVSCRAGGFFQLLDRFFDDFHVEGFSL